MKTEPDLSSANLRIYKYPINPCELNESITMPMGASILCIKSQNNIPYIWAQVSPENAPETRNFTVCVTGSQIKENMKYIDTVLLDKGKYVIHVFEALEHREAQP